METVKMILENWVYFFILLILGLLTVYAILRFMKLTPKQQLEKVKVALLYMVTEAEKELKSKTGRIKRINFESKRSISKPKERTSGRCHLV